MIVGVGTTATKICGHEAARTVAAALWDTMIVDDLRSVDLSYAPPGAPHRPVSSEGVSFRSCVGRPARSSSAGTATHDRDP